MSGTLDIDLLAKSQHTRLRNFILKHIHDNEAVEDVLQQTYLVALEQCSRFQGNAQPQTWVFGIALNLVRENNRKGGKNAYHLPIEHYESLIKDPQPCPETHMQNHRYMRVLTAKFELLPEHMQRVLELSSMENKDYNDCAKTLNVPVGTVRSRLSRARSLLKRHIEESSSTA